MLIYALICDAKTVKQLDDKKSVKFEDVIGSSVFGARGFPGTWISPTEFTFTSSDNLTIFDMSTNSSRVLLDRNFSVRIFNLLKNKIY